MCTGVGQVSSFRNFNIIILQCVSHFMFADSRAVAGPAAANQERASFNVACDNVVAPPQLLHGGGWGHQVHHPQEISKS